MDTSLDSINEIIVAVSMEYAAVKIEEFPTIILEVTGISRRRLFFNFQKEFNTLIRLLGALLKAGNDDVTYAGDFDKYIISQKSSTHETRCLKRLWPYFPKWTSTTRKVASLTFLAIAVNSVCAGPSHCLTKTSMYSFWTMKG